MPWFCNFNEAMPWFCYFIEAMPWFCNFNEAMPSFCNFNEAIPWFCYFNEAQFHSNKSAQAADNIGLNTILFQKYFSYACIIDIQQIDQDLIVSLWLIP